MTVQFQFTPANAGDLIRMSLATLLSRRVPMLACWAGPLTCLTGCLILAATHSAQWLWAGALPAIWQAFLVYSYVIGRRRLVEHILTKQGPCEVELLPEALVVRYPHVTARYKWTAFTECRETRRLLAICSPKLIIPVPRHAFASEQQVTEFRAAVRKYLASA